MAQAGPVYYPDNTTNFDINVILGNMASSINDAYTPSTADTGWMPMVVSTAGGATGGTIQYRAIGKLVIVRFDVIWPGMPVGNNTLSADAIPAALRPITIQARGAAYFGGAYIGVATVTTSGLVQAAHQTGAPRNNPSGAVVYAVG